MSRKKKVAVTVTVEELIRQYVSQITGTTDIEVQIIDDVIVLIRQERWHIYINQGQLTFIGCFVDEDVTICDILRKEAYAIQYIYDSKKNEQTV